MGHPTGPWIEEQLREIDSILDSEAQGMAEQPREQGNRRKTEVKDSRKEAAKVDRRDILDNPSKAKERVFNPCRT